MMHFAYSPFSAKFLNFPLFYFFLGSSVLTMMHLRTMLKRYLTLDLYISIHVNCQSYLRFIYLCDFLISILLGIFAFTFPYIRRFHLHKSSTHTHTYTHTHTHTYTHTYTHTHTFSLSVSSSLTSQVMTTHLSSFFSSPQMVLRNLHWLTLVDHLTQIPS